MPIEIRELVIKARVEPEPARQRPPRAPEKECGCGASLGADELARVLADLKER